MFVRRISMRPRSSAALWPKGMSAEDAALRLADLKAAAVARREPEALVIGADQILVCDGVWFDKPADVAAAREQLRALRGRSAYTGDRGRVPPRWRPCLARRRHAASRHARLQRRVPRGLSGGRRRYASPARSVLTDWRAVVCSCSTRSKATIPPFWVFPCCRCCRFFAEALARSIEVHRLRAASAGCGYQSRLPHCRVMRVAASA